MTIFLKWRISFFIFQIFFSDYWSDKCINEKKIYVSKSWVLAFFRPEKMNFLYLGPCPNVWPSSTNYTIKIIKTIKRKCKDKLVFSHGRARETYPVVKETRVSFFLILGIFIISDVLINAISRLQHVIALRCFVANNVSLIINYFWLLESNPNSDLISCCKKKKNIYKINRPFL